MIDGGLTLALLGSAALAGGASLGGGLMANQSREEQASTANKYSVWLQEGQAYHNAVAADQAQKWAVQNWKRNADWLEWMSNTAYRRSFDDMRQAGLNPLLAYQRGGASTPSSSAPGGAMSSVGTPGPGAMANVENVLGTAAGSAMSAAQTIAGLHQTMATVDQTEANTRLLAAEEQLRHDQQQLARAQTAEAAARTITEAERPGFIRAQTATEAMNPALRAAETAAQGALAGERTESTVGLRQENERFRNWGPRSSAADTGANLEAVARRGAASGASRSFLEGMDQIMRGIGAGQSGYSGPRRLPSGPARPPAVDDPYGLMAR